MFRPMRDLVLLRRVREHPFSDSETIARPLYYRRNWHEYVVLLVGRGCRSVQPGMRVLAPKYPGTEIRAENVEALTKLGALQQSDEFVRICREDDLLAIIDEERSSSKEDGR